MDATTAPVVHGAAVERSVAYRQFRRVSGGCGHQRLVEAEMLNSLAT
jgi:hypothetical protein